ncbi:hypothetical protein VCUG_00420 [Vavraia culicis subsp. floridensis]|uniref:Endoribonuclease YSH1 n=1 Tax=Vavraia culicis (isolate floridensis) TaxID=948595 RepID=L2GXT6_VAVCU|nr:uncharacterized protein VCUG_00420 [Vavraia culicis subsp. floridensis]ELA48182.1 hypothetical protein VCUG_00420 [Vavraia culicis subsp. floridensis]
MILTENLTIMPLGAGNEVGRSCIHITYKSLSILLDCGVHPAYTGTSSLPFLDLINLSTVDAVFITHFHLDHAGALPYLTEKTNFAGKVFMTHPTKAILRWLLNDYIRIINANTEIDFYSEKDLNNCYDKIIAIDYNQTVVVKDFKVSALNAGHVLGAAMFMIENDRVKILYTGDYSTEEDRHLKGADTAWISKYGNMDEKEHSNDETVHHLDVLICESTYGVQCHLPREERERRFTQVVNDIVTRGGKCLLPVFALGRAQELLLILEDYWDRNPHLHNIPIYYASALANRCLSIYQAYTHMMNLKIKKDAFNFKHIRNLKSVDNHLIKNACVVMASPGMLQSGLSRELFESWCEDANNGTVIPGYCVQGTLAKEIMTEPKEIVAMNGHRLRLNMRVEYISFSAHVDYVQNTSFIEKCTPRLVMLVHGEVNEMMRLKAALEKKHSVLALKNGEQHEIKIRKESVAVGKNLVEGDIEGVVVNELSGIRVYRRDEMSCDLYQEVMVRDRTGEPDTRTGNSTGNNGSEMSVSQVTIKNAFNATPSLIKQHLLNFFPFIRGSNNSLSIQDIKLIIEDEIVLIYRSTYVNDLLACTIIRLIERMVTKESVKISKISKKSAIVKVLKNYYEVIENEDDVEISDEGRRVVISEKGIRGTESLIAEVRKIIKKVVSIL